LKTNSKEKKKQKDGKIRNEDGRITLIIMNLKNKTVVGYVLDLTDSG
jgi:hypothetical protein